ncbi:MAG: metallophosphoesterase family protein [Clostridia bacterium]|nr:metallophosphoesterase family protein [Clostridia bacterium]
MIYFTADTHFGSEKVRIYSLRPFVNLRQMDKIMIKNWNKTAKKDDYIYHLGDFGSYNTIKKLKGKVILIMGNYEINDKERDFKSFKSYKKYLLSLGFYDVIDERGLRKIFKDISDEEIYLTHKPMDCDPNCFNLFGHIHGHSRAKDFGLNVGVDCYNYKLVTVENINFLKKAIDEKIFDDNVFCQKSNLINKK